MARIGLLVVRLGDFGNSLTPDGGTDLRSAHGQHIGCGTHTEADLSDGGIDRAAHIVSNHHTPDSHAAGRARPHAGLGLNDRVIGGRDRQAATGRDLQLRFGSGLRQGSHDGLRLGTDQVAGQHQAGRSTGSTRTDFLGHRGRDLLIRLCRDVQIPARTQ